MKYKNYTYLFYLILIEICQYNILLFLLYAYLRLLLFRRAFLRTQIKMMQIIDMQLCLLCVISSYASFSLSAIQHCYKSYSNKQFKGEGPVPWMNSMRRSVSRRPRPAEREIGREREKERAWELVGAHAACSLALTQTQRWTCFGIHFAAGKLFAPICTNINMCSIQQQHQQQQQLLITTNNVSSSSSGSRDCKKQVYNGWLTDRLVAMVKVAIEAAKATHHNNSYNNKTHIHRYTYAHTLEECNQSLV